MNRLYGVIVADIVCFAIFIGLAFAGRVTNESETVSGDTTKVSSVGVLKPRTGGRELRLAMETEPPTLDPISIADTFSDGVACKVYNKLLRTAVNEKQELEILPDLAESYSISPDAKIYTFKLRKGVHFHNGREMKANDVVYSLKRLLSPISKRADLMFPFVKGSTEFYESKDPEKLHKDAPNLGFRAPDEYTVVIELNEPFAPFKHHLCTSSCSVVPQEAAESTTAIFSRTPVGTGPFKFVEWISSQHILLKRNDDYFMGKPKLERIRFMMFKDGMLRLENFMAGNLDAAVIPNGHVLQAEAQVGVENMSISNSLRTNYIGFGMPNGKFTGKADLTPYGTNKLVRQALSCAMDREYLCNKVLEKRGIPAYGVLPPGMDGFNKNRPPLKKDLAKARALLAQAGYPEGKGLPPITLIHRGDEDTKNICQAFQNDFEQIGVHVELQPLEWSRFLETVEIEPQPMFYLGWVADYPDPDNFLFVLFNSKQFGSPGNQTWFLNKEVDELTEKARTITDMSERAKLYSRVEDILLDEMPWVPTVHMKNKVLLRKEIKGIRGHVTPLDTGVEFPQVEFMNVEIE